MDPAVATAGLSRVFRRRVALDAVSLRVESGEIFALLGPNGGGKTTLFRILATMLAPTSGTASVFGHDVCGDAASVRRCLGVVFQSPSLDPFLTVEENLRYGGNLHGLHGADLARRIAGVAELLGVNDRLRDRAGELSGGLQRRVEIAKSLLPRPRLLLLDEPSTGLDPRARHELRAVLRRLRDGSDLTVVLTTHLMDEAEQCGRVAVLHHGKLIACDAPDALRATIGGDVLTLAARSPEQVAEQLAARLGLAAKMQDGLLRIELDRAHEQVARIVDAFPGEILSVTTARPTLEDVFLRLTGERFESAPTEDGR
jgi:ABC-2 type transport system ATP-binding protein